jgi:catechol 2,3-dioxygenase-like lactoylglutathione lyase family enzyme
MKLAALVSAVLSAALLSGQTPVPRPRILGIAHLAVFVSNLERARWFYRDFLGLDEMGSVRGPDGRIDVAVLSINERQTIELIDRPTAGEGQLDHVALQTDDVRRMREYVVSRGVGAATEIDDGPGGYRGFFVTDPDGHRLEFVELRSAEKPRSVAAGGRSPVSDRALHAGILVGELAKAAQFYSGVLGFDEIWRGSAAKSPTLSWVNMRVPDGTDYLEFMLYDDKPAPDRRGTAHHLCLLVPDAAEAVALLDARPARHAYTRSIEVRTGINRKRQVNLSDPDGTRVELMEPTTVDGVPAAPSTLPPPR